MKEKLLALMQNEGLRSSQLAEILDVNPAGISHILAGRNKPGFDLLQKILRRFPRVNPDWLLPVVIGNPKIISQLHGGFLAGQLKQPGNKIHCIPISLTAKAVKTPAVNPDIQSTRQTL